MDGLDNQDGSGVKIYEGPLAEARLLELGLTMEELVVAVLAAEMERRSCSPFAPSTAPGFKAWSAGFETLAERKVGPEWVRTETKGLPRILNPDTAIAVAIVSGDEGVGRRASCPKSKTPRGAQSAFLVRSNEKQIYLPFVEGKKFRPLPAEVEEITYWLLLYSDGIANFRAELSLPVSIGEDRRLSGWNERIILDIPDLTFPSQRRSDDEETPFEAEVNIRPRT